MSGIYSRPTGIDAVANNTIDSGKYNSNVADVEADLNLPRPVIAGGTGATSASGARDNLDAEVAAQNVTNYNTHVFENGSFFDYGGVPGAPTAGAFLGVAVIHGDPNYAVLEARQAGVPQLRYVRHKTAGVWGAWTTIDNQATTDAINAKVAKGGDTMTGNLNIENTDPFLVLNKTAVNTHINTILGQSTGRSRWAIYLGNGDSEDGGNTGSNFKLVSFTDTGTAFQVPLSISRPDGRLTLSADPFDPFHAATKQYADTKLAVAGGQMNGAIGIGVPPNALPGYFNNVTGVDLETSGIGCFSRATSPTVVCNQNADGILQQFFRSGVSVGTISITTTSTAYNTSSDGTLKEDLQPAGITAGQILNDTEIYDFKWKVSGERAYGVIAQQAAPIYPGPFFHDDDKDRWYVDYSKYVPILIQEAKTLKTRLADLETKLTAAMSRLDVLDKFREKIEAL